MGTHPSGPSVIKETKEHLSQWLTHNVTAVGMVPNGYPNTDLPYLFKILSVKTALSIQV